MNKNPIVIALVAALWMSLGAAQELVVVMNEDMPTFDPHGTTRAEAHRLNSNIFDTLIFRDAAGELEPALATDWEAIDDHSWRFVLRDDVVWHDGVPFTAEDVKYTFERAANDAELPAHSLFTDFDEVEVVNEHELIVHTSLPDPLMPNRLSSTTSVVLPRHYYEDDDGLAASSHPIGTGPFRFVEYRPDDRVVMAAFEDHWRGQAAFDELTFRIILENTTAVSELTTGGVHVTDVDVTDAERVEESDVARIEQQRSNRVCHWTFNVSDDLATSDPVVREAIDYAVDTAVIIEVVRGGYGTPVRARVAPGVSFAPMEYYDTYLYDPEQAVALLEEAGYGPGELEITLMGANSASDIAEVTGAMLEAVGIDASIQLFESSVWSSRYWHAGEFEHMAYVCSGNPMSDYGDTLRALRSPDGSHADRSHWHHERFSQLVTDAGGELDPVAREEILREATDILLAERPQLYLDNVVRFKGVSNDVDWTPRQDERMWMFDARPIDD